MLRIAAALLLLATNAHAAEVIPIETPGAVRQVVQTARGTYAETERGSYRIESCDKGPVCLIPGVIRDCRQERHPMRCPTAVCHGVDG